MEGMEFMSTVIICIILIIICIFSVKSYMKKVSHGCCGSGGDEVKKIKPKDKNIFHYSFTFKIDIEGMSCDYCKRRVENAFNEKEGFYAVVNLKKKSALVRTKRKVSQDELKEIILEQGYRAISIKMMK